MLILNAITLFTPLRTNIYDASAISSYQQEYYNVLRSYLSTQCCETEAREAYESLMQKLENLHQLNQSLQRIYSQLNPKDLDPLLRELFVAPQP
ncbi:Ligand-binding domain of nuclear hormone receptor family protein [Aphelenchoides avenae]|nr:Ligand-binding domain of nuclear hormone receptor family protein [Aphelenchus avenae]